MVATGIKGDPSDSVEGWSVMTGPDNPKITITVNDQVHPVTVTGDANDESQHIQIVATCSQLEETP